MEVMYDCTASTLIFALNMHQVSMHVYIIRIHGYMISVHICSQAYVLVTCSDGHTHPIACLLMPQQLINEISISQEVLLLPTFKFQNACSLGWNKFEGGAVGVCSTTHPIEISKNKLAQVYNPHHIIL